MRELSDIRRRRYEAGPGRNQIGDHLGLDPDGGSGAAVFLMNSGSLSGRRLNQPLLAHYVRPQTVSM